MEWDSGVFLHRTPSNNESATTVTCMCILSKCNDYLEYVYAHHKIDSPIAPCVVVT